MENRKSNKKECGSWSTKSAGDIHENKTETQTHVSEHFVRYRHHSYSGIVSANLCYHQSPGCHAISCNAGAFVGERAAQP